MSGQNIIIFEILTSMQSTDDSDAVRDNLQLLTSCAVNISLVTTYQITLKTRIKQSTVKQYDHNSFNIRLF